VAHQYYSQRIGSNPRVNGLELSEIRDLFVRTYARLRVDGYFDESVGSNCVDTGFTEGSLGDVDLAILLAIRKKHLWPIEDRIGWYTEDDLLDIIEFLFQHVSKPIDGTMHNYGRCGMHWETFNQAAGRAEFRQKINDVLGLYERAFELSDEGDVLERAQAGFEAIFAADLPTKDEKITTRISAAVLRFRRHGSSLDDRRQAVRDLADVLEYLRPKVKEFLTSADDADLFNIANNFGIRHHNDKQKTGYDANLWLSWMFYFYLSTIHVVLRKIEHERLK
jgi:hypothetical protein